MSDIKSLVPVPVSWDIRSRGPYISSSWDPVGTGETNLLTRLGSPGSNILARTLSSYILYSGRYSLVTTVYVNGRGVSCLGRIR
jgi:hypothetical protein